MIFERKALDDGILRGDRPQIVPKGQWKTARLVSAGEINRYLDARPERSRRGDYAKIVRLLILLGCRFSEIAALRLVGRGKAGTAYLSGPAPADAK